MASSAPEDKATISFQTPAGVDVQGPAQVQLPVLACQANKDSNEIVGTARYNVSIDPWQRAYRPLIVGVNASFGGQTAYGFFEVTPQFLGRLDVEAPATVPVQDEVAFHLEVTSHANAHSHVTALLVSPTSKELNEEANVVIMGSLDLPQATPGLFPNGTIQVWFRPLRETWSTTDLRFAVTAFPIMQSQAFPGNGVTTYVDVKMIAASPTHVADMPWLPVTILCVALASAFRQRNP